MNDTVDITSENAPAAATMMFQEASRSGAAVDLMLRRNSRVLSRVAAYLRERPASAIVTCARGSSDNGCTYGRYLLGGLLGHMTASASPSISSLYKQPPARKGDLFIAVSQSGRSPDLIEATRLARRAGAYTVTMINDEEAPLADEADEVIALSAGPECSVAATKSFICTQAAFLALAAHTGEAPSLLRSLDGLPAQLDAAFREDWSKAVDLMGKHDRLLVLGRGPSLGTAQEAALKLKEVAGMHAEAISSAEVLHGPIALLRKGSAVLIFSQQDASSAATADLVQRLLSQGVEVLIAGARVENAICLPVVAGLAELSPILEAQSFYAAVANLSVRLGYDPDRPFGLTKITKTL